MADVPALAVTGYGAEEDVRRGRDAGFVGQFVKPLDLKSLQRTIRETLNAAQRTALDGARDERLRLWLKAERWALRRWPATVRVGAIRQASSGDDQSRLRGRDAGLPRRHSRSWL